MSEEILSEIRDLLKQAIEELNWLTKRDMTDLDFSSVETTTIPVGGAKTFFERRDQIGEIFLGAISALSTDITVRITVDAYAAVELLSIADLLTVGATAPNGILWATQTGVAPIVYAMFANMPLAFKWRIKLEAVNKGTSDATLLSGVVLSRIRR